MRASVVFVCLLLATACKREPSGTGTAATASAPRASSKLGAQLLGAWNDQEDGTLAWEFFDGGKCKVFGNMDCQYEVGTESGSTLRLRYKPMDNWEDVEVTFDGADKASWKNLSEAKSDPDASPTKLVRASGK